MSAKFHKNLNIMKLKTVKIQQNTLFIYKSLKPKNGKGLANETTDTTTVFTTTVETTGFNK